MLIWFFLSAFTFPLSPKFLYTPQENIVTHLLNIFSAGVANKHEGKREKKEGEEFIFCIGWQSFWLGLQERRWGLHVACFELDLHMCRVNTWPPPPSPLWPAYGDIFFNLNFAAGSTWESWKWLAYFFGTNGKAPEKFNWNRWNTQNVAINFDLLQRLQLWKTRQNITQNALLKSIFFFFPRI